MWRDITEETAADPGCVFCKIVAGELPSTEVYSDDEILAFRDASPIAKVHVLVIPKTHVTRLEGATEADDQLIGRIVRTASTIAGRLGIGESGYRVAVNQGTDAGQLIEHLHFHLLGGQNLSTLGEPNTGA